MQAKNSLSIVLVASLFALNVTQAEPMILSNAQMDTVTAGALNVIATANAFSLGQPAITQTYTGTQAIRYSKDGWTLEVGFGVASAAACCGAPSVVNANTFAAANGNYVRINQNAQATSSPYVKYSTSATSIVSITRPD
ncbi:MAG: hypothetical protein V3U75_02590 [Methylococcaceae bacterium]